MIRSFVRSLIHNATVTHSDGVSLRLDAVILRAAEIRAMEQVEVINVATGNRFHTWVEEGAEGEVRAPGVRTGDTVTVVAYGLLHDGQTIGHRARVVTLGANNVVVSIAES